MKRFVASTPEAEVLGIGFLSLITNIKADEIAPFLSDQGLKSEGIQPDGWYPHQTLMNIYRAIQESRHNVTENFVSIGMKIMEQAPFPPNMKTLDEALMSLEPTYQAAHRYHTERGWISDKVSQCHYLITADDPYPDELCYGLLWGLVRRFAPKGSHFKVQQLPPTTPDDPIRFEVTW